MKKSPLVLFVALAIIAAGCVGGDGGAKPAAAVDTGAAPNDAASAPSIPTPMPPTLTEAREIEHALGATTIEGAPARVVVLEWPYVEALLALGVQPVGVADVAGYTELVKTSAALADTVVDVGTRQEPSIEKIAELQPDLIIGVKFRHEKIYDTLTTIAPTLVFDTFPADGKQFDAMEGALRGIATALGSPDAAARALTQMTATLDGAKARLADTGHAGERVLLAQVLAGDNPQIRLFQDHQVAVQFLQRIGLDNAWDGEFAANGFSTVGLEALSGVDDASFLYVLSSGASITALSKNPVWNEFQFVEEGRLYDLSGAWLLAGPLSGQEFAKRAVNALAPESSGPRTIQHALGATTVEGAPTRVVALEWTYAEDLLALGVQPAGVADVAGYNKWVAVQPALADAVVDVGTRQEPSIEKIAELQPDLIIGVKFRHEKIYDTLTTIAPTVLFDPYPTEDAQLTQYDEMRQTFLAIASAMDREARGVSLLADLDAYFASQAKLLEGLAQKEVVLAQAYTWKDAPTMRLFTSNSMASEILAQLGLKNAWSDGFQTYGFSTVGLEALESVQDANFLYVVQSDDNVFEGQWKDHPVWTNLTFVQEARTYPLGGDTWVFGGPLSARVFVDKVVDVML